MAAEKRVFTGLDERDDYHRTVAAVDGGTVSPGGAGALLRCTRQNIWKLIAQGQVRVWQYFDGRTTLPEMVDVSVRDLLVYGIRTGRITKPGDVGLGGRLIEQQVEELLGVDQEKLVLVD